MWTRRVFAGVLVLSLAQAAMADDEFFTFHGTTIGASLGLAVDGAGDVNGDGVGDVVTGSRTLFGTGVVTVRSGRDGSVLHSWSGESSFGQCVAGAGDVDADGFADVIVGEDGKATVFSGKTGEVLHVKTDILGQLGASVDGAGDVNHDGSADFIVGAPLGVIPGSNGIGYVKVYSGTNGAVLFQFPGDIIADWFGYSVCGAGDLNKDGYPDFVIGAPRFYYHAYLGRVVARSGKDGSYLGGMRGFDDGGFFGSAVAGGADLNRDGYADFVVGAPSEDVSGRNYHIVDCGMVRAFSGKDFSLMHEWSDYEDGARFGHSVAMAGRVNDDLYPDVVIGAPEATASYSTGEVKLLSGKDGTALRTWHGTIFKAEAFGRAVAGAGDINDDGFNDVIVGDPADKTGGPGAGAAYVFSGLAYQGSWTNYGTGWPGTHGVPSFTIAGTPRLCGEIEIHIGNSLDAATAGAILVGFSQAALDSHMGGLILVGLPWLVFPVTLPSAGVDLPVDVVCDTTLAGIEVYMQVLESDPGASFGTSFSRGVELVLGL